MKTNNRKINEAFEKANEFIEQMTEFDDKQLEKHLDLFRKQMLMAHKQKKADAFVLLQEYERQVIEARVAKLDKGKSPKNKK